MKNCMGCLKEGVEGYCRTCINNLFDGVNISHILTFTRPEYNEIKLNQSNRFSISGIQTKHSVRIINKKLELTETSGQYILKPVPNGPFYNLNSVPINENLTMQIAKQIFGIAVMENGLVQFKDGETAYITKRFDVLASGKKRQQEDMAQVIGRTEETHGRHYKYDYSYEEVAESLKENVGAYAVEIEKYFKLVLFNYLFCNGDAHLKNFSVYRNDEYRDYLLTPAYDLLNTGLHVPGESDTALSLFKDNYETEAYKAGSKYTSADFIEFGIRIGINPNRVPRTISEFTSKSKETVKLVSRSLLDENIKDLYINKFEERVERIKQ